MVLFYYLNILKIESYIEGSRHFFESGKKVTRKFNLTYLTLGLILIKNQGPKNKVHFSKSPNYKT